MITGAHTTVYSTNSAADRAFFTDVLKLPSADAGGGWLIFGLPPAELAFHPSSGNDVHELYLMCDEIHAFVAAMKAHGVECGPVSNQGWGLVTKITLPGGGKLGVYEARHARPKHPGAASRRAAKKKVAKKKVAKKKVAKRKAAPKKRRVSSRRR